MTKNQFGFSLIEMAMVLLIISLIISSLLLPLSTQITQKRLKTTQRDLEIINESLLGFLVINNRLPYPASNSATGIEDSKLDGQEGYLPWTTLALDNSKTDAWGQAFRYRVDTQYTSQSLPVPPNTSNNLKIRNLQNTPLTNENINSDVIAIIFSKGKDGQANKANGGTLDNIYTQDVFIENNFDDRLIFLPKTIVINRLVEAGLWP
jgi:prepilin-type N-terminal cleavage/methylation domain-containing protein